MWRIEEILINEMKTLKEEYKQFMESDIFSELSYKSRQIVDLRSELIDTNIQMFDAAIRQYGQVGEDDYNDLLESTFTCARSLREYRDTAMNRRITNIEQRCAE